MSYGIDPGIDEALRQITATCKADPSLNEMSVLATVQFRVLATEAIRLSQFAERQAKAMEDSAEHLLNIEVFMRTANR